MELIYTPTSHKTESLLGYVLRISEKNGYESPWIILAHAGFNQGEMNSAAFQVEKLARILAKPPSELQHLANFQELADGTRDFCILGQSLGAGLSYSPLRRHNPAFCPTCVKEDGYIDAAWDISLIVACPKHRRLVLDYCPNCRKRTTRPPLLVTYPVIFSSKATNHQYDY